MKKTIWVQNENGYMLITAIMLLFVATVLGLMVNNSSLTEIMLSGALQRYEEDFNTTEGAVMLEARAVSSGVTISRNGVERSYAIANDKDVTSIDGLLLSPTNPSEKVFDPGSDMDTSEFDTMTVDTPPSQWPMDNLLHSDASAADRYDYHYRVICSHGDVPVKGFDAGSFTGYVFEIGAKRNARIDIRGKKIGI
jgi:hypothetical protein